MHRNRRLFDLATKNSQRNAADELLSSIPESVRVILNNADVIYHPELSDLFSPVIHRSIELHKLGKLPMVGAGTLLTSSKEKALSHFFRWASELPKREYVLVIGGGNGFSFDGIGAWVSSLPGYVVQISDAIDVFKVLSRRGVEEVSIASRNGHNALVLEASSGFLPDEPSEKGVVYELSGW